MPPETVGHNETRCPRRGMGLWASSSSSEQNEGEGGCAFEKLHGEVEVVEPGYVTKSKSPAFLALTLYHAGYIASVCNVNAGEI